MRLRKKKLTAETLPVLRVIDISVYFQPRKMLPFANVSEYISGKKLPDTIKYQTVIQAIFAHK